MTRALAAAVAAGAVTMVLGGAAAAQESTVGEPRFSVERFTPAPGHAAFAVVEDPDVLPAGAWAWSAAVSLMARPIVLRDVFTEEVELEPVATRLGVELAAAYGLGARYQLGVALPMALQWGDRVAGIGLDDAALQRAVLGDLRLHGKVRIAGTPGQRGVAAALAATVILPTGADDQLAGEAATAVEWRLLVGWRAARWAVAGNAGLRLRTEEVRFLSPARPHGNELLGGLAAEVVVPVLALDRLWAIAEVTAVRGDSVGGDLRGPSPAEARGGLRLRLCGGWSVAVVGGAGITPDEVGAPAWRVAVQVGLDQAATSDVDRDGVTDGRDACEAWAEDRDGWQDGDGCPDADDDGDGIGDRDDDCPRVAEDVDGWRDADGCPDDEQR